MSSPASSFLLAFTTVFLAELGDKTQLALLALAGTERPWFVYLGGSAALVAASGLAVAVGAALGKWLDPRLLHYGSAALFVCIGLWLFLRGPAAA